MNCSIGFPGTHPRSAPSWHHLEAVLGPGRPDLRARSSPGSPWGARVHLWVQGGQDSSTLQQDLQAKVPDLHQVVRIRPLRPKAQASTHIYGKKNKPSLCQHIFYPSPLTIRAFKNRILLLVLNFEQWGTRQMSIALLSKGWRSDCFETYVHLFSNVVVRTGSHNGICSLCVS